MCYTRDNEIINAKGVLQMEINYVESVSTSPLFPLAMNLIKRNQIASSADELISDATIDAKAPTRRCKALVDSGEYTNGSNASHAKGDKSAFTLEEIQLFKNYFHNTPSRFKETNMRNYAYFVLGLNWPKRCGDIMNLRIGDLIHPDGTCQNYIKVTEQKTGKYSEELFTPLAQEAVLEYLDLRSSINLNDYLFLNYKTGEKMSVQGMRKMLQRTAAILGISHDVGTHTLRRTFATQAAQKGEDVRFIAKALNHAKPETTEIYIKKIRNTQDNFMLRNQL